MELDKYRNDQEVSQSFVVNMEAADVTKTHHHSIDTDILHNNYVIGFIVSVFYWQCSVSVGVH